MMNFLYGRTPQIVCAVVLALGLAAFWQLAILEERAIQRDTQARLDDEELTVRRMEMELGKTNRVANRYRQNLEEIQRFRRDFLGEKDERMVTISSFLHKTAREHGIQLDDVDYNRERSNDKGMEIHSITMPLLGRYRDIRQFVNSIENSGLFLVITEMSLEDESGQSGKVQVDLTLATYFEGAPS